MPKYLVHQVLPADCDVLRDHLEPGASDLAAQLVDSESVPVRWIWGCADIERNEWRMLFESPDDETIAAYFQRNDHPGIKSITRVMYVNENNLAWALVRGLAENRKRREAG